MNVKVFVMLFMLKVTEVLPCGASHDRQVPDPKARVAEEGQARTDYLTKETFTVDPEQDDASPKDPFTSYLLWPHFHFSGTFRSDVSTVNNNPLNFDTDKFTAADLIQGPRNWNPMGSGEWSVTGSVTHVCYANGHCVGEDEGDKSSEPLMGALIKDGGNKTFAKLVDLDPEAQVFSEIWGWRIRVGNLFSADFTPVPFQYMWKKMVTRRQGDSTLGAAYQSVLSNIRWIDTSNDSPFIRQLQTSVNNDNIDGERLSIRFNVDMYQGDYRKDNFTIGRVTGTIGLLGRKSPPFFTHGRMMKSMVSHLQDTPFYLDQRHRKVFVDFGNSLPIHENGTLFTDLYDSLLVAVPLNEQPSMTCSDDLLWLGVVYNQYPNWYQNSAGIQIFPALGSLSENEMEKLNSHPLVVVEASGNLPVLKCIKILLAEDRDGLDIHPYNTWTFRKNPGDFVQVQLLATEFGKPLPRARVRLDSCNCERIFSGGPEVGQPALDVPSYLTTDKNGLATVDIEAKDPQNNRSFIDGQLYPFIYSLDGQNKSCSHMCQNNVLMLLNSLVVVLVFDEYKLKGVEPTWLDDVYPIFKQYANLYPVMTKNFVDLGNYYDVINHKKAIKISLELPISHPNHMPVTRDLSKSKRQVIVEWLSKEKPPIGDPKRFYSVEHLQSDLQTALELEHATIPTYLTALASIKYSYNLEIQRVMKAIIIQEMMHMALVANILNAIGGEPSLHSKEFIPIYPSRLPGGVQPDLIVPIEKLSLGLIRNIFMKIEQPELEQQRISRFQQIFSFVHHHKRLMEGKGHCPRGEESEGCNIHESTVKNMLITDPMADGGRSSDCSFSKEQFLKDFKMHQLRNIHQTVDPEIDVAEEHIDMLEVGKHEKRKEHGKFPGDNIKIVKHHNTIGAFYNHILNALDYLTDCGKNNSIFKGDMNRQVDFGEWSVHGHTIKVKDYVTAVEAIEKIIEQGEGSSPCNPVAWDTGTKKDLSHYFLFYSVAEKHEIQVVLTDTSPGGSRDDSVIDYTKLCNATYYFNGSKIPFDPDGVWPMVSNPRMSKYKKGSNAYRQAERFNMVYTKLLKSLENVFNGRPETLKDALGLMFSVDLHLRNLLATPIDDNGDSDVGPNAGPTFDFTP